MKRLASKEVARRFMDQRPFDHRRFDALPVEVGARRVAGHTEPISVTARRLSWAERGE